MQNTEKYFSLHLPPADSEDKEHLNVQENRKLKQASHTQRITEPTN